MRKAWAISLCFSCSMLSAEPRPLPISAEAPSPFLERLDQDALGTLMRTVTEKPVSSRLRVVKIVGAAPPREGNRLLRKAFYQTSSVGMKCKLIEGLGQSGDPEQLDWLLERLKDPSLAIRCFAAWAIGELRQSRSVALLQKSFRGADRPLRLVLIDALGKQNHSTVGPWLFRELHDADVQVRFVAAKAFMWQKHPTFAQSLLERLWNESSQDVREALALAVGHSADDPLSKRLLADLRQEKASERQHVLEKALTACASPSVSFTLQTWLVGEDTLHQVQAARILAERPAVDLIPEVKRLLQKGSRQQKVLILSSLPAGSSPQVMEFIAPLLLSSDIYVREAALHAIERIRPTEADAQP